MSYVRDVGALARKDLLLELRARDTLPAMLLFVAAVFVVFHFAMPGTPSRLAASGLLWVAILFTALLGLGRAFVPEREQRVLDGLVLADVGICAVGTFLGAMAVATRARDLLLPLLFLPLAVPIVVGAVGGSVAPAPGRYLGFLALYDLLFAVICWASFEYVVAE